MSQTDDFFLENLNKVIFIRYVKRSKGESAETINFETIVGVLRIVGEFNNRESFLKSTLAKYYADADEDCCDVAGEKACLRISVILRGEPYKGGC